MAKKRKSGKNKVYVCKGLKQKKISSRYTLGADSNNKKSKELLIIKP